MDLLNTDLEISVTDHDDDQATLYVCDKTIFGSNQTSVVLGAEEVERSSRNGRKQFMMSGFEDGPWLAVQCRLFQRGEGWYTRQSWKVDENGLLCEKMTLQRPDEDDVTVYRVYKRVRYPDGEHGTALCNDTEHIGTNVKTILGLGVGAVGAGCLAWCWSRTKPRDS